SLFFFFQAEDGIRDFQVTGVQTCALPISAARRPATGARSCGGTGAAAGATRAAAGSPAGTACPADARPRRDDRGEAACARRERQDRKSTRLNSSHVKISYAVFCLKKKKQA